MVLRIVEEELYLENLEGESGESAIDRLRGSLENICLLKQVEEFRPNTHNLSKIYTGRVYSDYDPIDLTVKEKHSRGVPTQEASVLVRYPNNTNNEDLFFVKQAIVKTGFSAALILGVI